MNSKTNRKMISSLTALTISALLILLLFYSDECVSAAIQAMTLSVSSVVPTLFSYMILSSLIIRFDILSPLCRYIPTEKLFHLPSCTSSVIITGILCGFPIGAQGTARLYQSGRISKKDAQLLLALSSLVSPVFLTGYVGRMWGNKRFGILLYLINLLTLVLFGIAVKGGRDTQYCDSHSENNCESTSLIQALSEAISISAVSCLKITAYITFFSVMRCIFSLVIPELEGLFASTLEFSYGAYYGSVISGKTGAAVTGFSTGLASVSVLMQTYDIVSPLGIDMKYYMISKLCCAVTSSAVSWAYFSIFPMNSESIADVFSSIPTLSVQSIVFFVYLTAVNLYFMCKNRRNYKK